MSAVRSRVWVIGLCAAFLAGCGGGSLTGGGGGGGGNSTTVTVQFGGASMPAAVAASIGTGAFAAQTLTGGALTLTLPSGTSNYGLAYLCPAQSTLQDEFVFEASISDGTSLNVDCPSTASQTGTLTGSLDASAIPGVTSFQFASQNGSSVYQDGEGGGSSTNFSLPAVTGNDRVLVMAYANQNSGPVAAKNFDNQTVPGALNGGNAVVFAASDETTPEAIAYNNVPSGFSTPASFAEFVMAGTTFSVFLSTNATTQYAALPASATENGDYYFVDGSAYATNATAGVSSAVLAATTTAGGPVSFSFPAPWSYGGPTPAALPSFTESYAGFSGSANVSQNAFLQWNPSSGVTDVISVEATAGFQNGSTTLAIPDLSSVTGFLPSPASGTQLEWVAWMEQQSWGLTSSMPLGGTASQVETNGQFTVP